MSALQKLHGLFRLRVLQLAALVLLLAFMAALAFAAKTTVRDPDIWWHLKVGDWMIQHQAVPYVGIFSRTAGAHPWVAYSWGYEVLLALAYAWFGLNGIAAFGIVLTMAVSFTLFWMLHRLSGSFWLAWSLSFVGSLAYLFSLMPRPVFFSMILFNVVLGLLLEAQRGGRIELLYWLPVLFAIWANLHIQFLYGLLAVGLFTGAELLRKLAVKAGIAPGVTHPAPLPLPPLVAVFLASIAATCVGPYSYHLSRVVKAYLNSRAPNFMIQEMAAFSFRSFTHYILLLLMAAAFYFVGRRHEPALFKLALLIVASVMSFHSQHDAWFLGISAVACIADLPGRKPHNLPVLRFREMAAGGAILAVLVIFIGRQAGIAPEDLDREVSRVYPVNAANFVRENRLPGPLYNNLDWGGFLIWYLPEYPVAVDGRNELYGDEIDLRTYKSAQGDSYTDDPYLNESALVLLPKQIPLANLLAVDRRFHVIYQDQIAVVFARNPGSKDR